MDIGSNTVRLLVASGEPGRWEREGIEHSVTRLSGGFNGNLQPEAMTRTADAVAGFAETARKSEAWPIRAVCTGVTRRADNTSEFLDHIQKKAGFTPVIISGETEARLTAKGALSLINRHDQPTLIFDIGGFSTEIIFVDNSGPVHISSLDIGVVRLNEQYFEDGPVRSSRIEQVERILNAAFCKEYLIAQKIGFCPEILIGTAGTATSLAAMDLKLEYYDSSKVEGHVVTSNRMVFILEQIIKMTPAERLQAFPSLEPGREDVILPGILISLTIKRIFSLKEIVVTEGGLLEGLIESDSLMKSVKSD